MDGRPWGLSGPEFLIVYATALAGVSVVTALARWGVSATGRRPASAPPGLGVYEWAYLCGGPARVAETAVAGLVDSGALRVSSWRRLHFAGEPAGDDFQQAVLNRVAVCDTVAKQHKNLRRMCGPLRDSLRERGLVCSATAHAVVLATLTLFPLLVVINVARVVTGVRLGYPIVGLLTELLITVIAWSAAGSYCQQPLRSRTGRALTPPHVSAVHHTPGLLRVHRHRADAVSDVVKQAMPPPIPATTPVAVCWVAAHGIAAYPDPEIARLLRPRPSAGGGAGGGGWTSGGHGGGGCGGGGL